MEKFIQTRGVKLSYLDWGKSEQPVLLFVHSLFMSANDWKKIAPAFTDEYHVLAVNLRGHATSEWNGPYNFEVMADDLHHFLAALNIEQCTIVGHSLGGIASYFFAATHPAMVKALVLEEAPPPKPVSKPFNFGAKPKGKLPYDWNAITSIVDLLNHPDPAWWKLSEKIIAPTLVIGGGPKSHVPQLWNEELASSIRNSRLVTLGGGHFVHSKHPRQFTETVNEFLYERNEH